MGHRRTAVKRYRNAPGAPLDDLIVSGGGGVPITSAKYRAEMDIDRDGDVDSTDQTLRGVGGFVAALPKGALSTPGPGSGGGGVDSTVGWSGYRYDQPTRLYAVRFRFYDAETFRWLNRDPAGYVDSMNLYGYGIGSGIGWSDPFGLGGPFFAGGVTLDGEVITYDQIKMRGMSFMEKVAAGWYDDTFRWLRGIGAAGLAVFGGYYILTVGGVNVFLWGGIEGAFISAYYQNEEGTADWRRLAADAALGALTAGFFDRFFP